jgi:hypothetical protein
MRLRARHLAGILLLLATLGTAEASAVRAGAAPIPNHCIRMLLAQQATQLRDTAPVDPNAREPLAVELPAASRRPLAAIHPMTAAAAHAAALHAVTGSSL